MIKAWDGSFREGLCCVSSAPTLALTAAAAAWASCFSISARALRALGANLFGKSNVQLYTAGIATIESTSHELRV